MHLTVSVHNITTHTLKEKADLLMRGQEHRVPGVDGKIKRWRDNVKQWEDTFQQRKQQLLELEQEEG